MTPPPRDHRPEGASLAAGLRDLADLVDRGDPADLPDAAVAELVLTSAAMSGRIDALVTPAIGAFDAHTIWSGDGTRSCGGWLAARTELSRARAGGLTTTARDLRACPHVEGAYGSGEVGTAKVRLLLDARQAWPDRFQDAEADLVERVAPLSVAHAAVVCATWAALAEAARAADGAERAGEDPDAVPEPDPVQENRAHHSQTLGGRYRLDADYDPVTGAEIAAAVQGWIDRRFDDGTYRSDDGLAVSQRVAAALADLTRRGAVAGQVRHGDPRPSVSIHIDAKTLAGEPVTDLDDLVTRCCSLDDGTPVSRSSAERLLCTARVSALLLRIAEDGTIETLGVTDLLRDATRRQRRALRRRDGGCIFTGCHAPPDQCEVHHVLPWENDGPTLLANLALLCSYHHHLVHEGGWRLWRSLLDGALHLSRPDGTPVALVPHGRLVTADHPVSPERPPPRPTRLRLETRRERHQREHERPRGHPPDPPQT